MTPGKDRITKRGNRHLRRVIWLMTTRVIHYSDIFKAYLSQTKKGGFALQDGCTGHCSQIDSCHLCHSDTTDNFLSASESIIVD